MAAIPYDKDATTASVTDATNSPITITVDDCEGTRLQDEKTHNEQLRERIQEMSCKEFRQYFRNRRRR